MRTRLSDKLPSWLQATAFSVIGILFVVSILAVYSNSDVSSRSQVEEKRLRSILQTLVREKAKKERAQELLRVYGYDPRPAPLYVSDNSSEALESLAIIESFGLFFLNNTDVVGQIGFKDGVAHTAKVTKRRGRGL